VLLNNGHDRFKKQEPQNLAMSLTTSLLLTESGKGVRHQAQNPEKRNTNNYKNMKTKSFLSLLTLACCFAVSGYSQSFLTNGLVGYYPFNGTANDASGNSNHGQVQGAQLVPDRFQHPNAAYSFNGTSYITLTNSFVLPGDWTISAWARPSTLNQEGFILHIGRDDGTQATANGFGIDFNNGGLFGLLSGVAKWNSGLTISNTNEWVQVVMQRSGTLTTLFLNGSLGPVSQSGTPPAPIGGFIGSESESTLMFKGGVDDVRVYNRSLQPSTFIF
jgi:hypothetical protein